MRNELSFDFDYYYKENGGVLSARLFGIERAKTELIMLVDSDDEITENAVEICLNTWNGLSAEDREKFYGLKTLCRDYETNKVVGSLFPGNINACSYRKYFWEDSRGERFTISRRDVLLQQYREYKSLMAEANASFVPEETLHYKYEMQYRYYCINDALRIYHQEGNNSLSRGSISRKSCWILYYGHTYVLAHYFPNEKLPIKLCIHHALYTIKFGLLLRYRMSKIFNDVGNSHNRVVLVLSLPLGIGNYLLGQKIKEDSADEGSGIA